MTISASYRGNSGRETRDARRAGGDARRETRRCLLPAMKWLARKATKVSWSNVKSQRLTSQSPTRLTSNVSRPPPSSQTIAIPRACPAAGEAGTGAVT